MLSYHYLLDIALILLSTKVLGLITQSFHMPQVVGALLSGLILGPALLNILHGTEFLSQLAELGVIVIMFSAGLETDLIKLKSTGKAGFMVALLGVMVPLAMGTGFGYLFSPSNAGQNAMLQNIFIGVILTATSVSITVETLKEMGRLSTRVGNTILAAALIDDVLGLVCLTIVSSLGGDSTEGGIWIVLVKIVLFFLLALVAGVIIHKGLIWYSTFKKNAHLRRFPLLALVLCLAMAYTAEHFFGVADIIGAFAAGLVIGGTNQAPYIESRIRPISYMLLTPIFFASIGINIELPSMDMQLVVASVVLLAISIVSKLVGCGLGARLSGMNFRESVQVGLGMVCRGEVALIVANKGRAMGLIPPEFFGPVVIMVVFTAVLTPVLLKLAFRSEGRYSGLEENPIADRMELATQLEDVSRQLLEKEIALKQPSKKGKDE